MSLPVLLLGMALAGRGGIAPLAPVAIAACGSTSQAAEGTIRVRLWRPAPEGDRLIYLGHTYDERPRGGEEESALEVTVRSEEEFSAVVEWRGSWGTTPVYLAGHLEHRIAAIVEGHLVATDLKGKVIVSLSSSEENPGIERELEFRLPEPGGEVRVQLATAGGEVPPGLGVDAYLSSSLPDVADGPVTGGCLVAFEAGNGLDGVVSFPGIPRLEYDLEVGADVGAYVVPRRPERDSPVPTLTGRMLSNGILTAHPTVRPTALFPHNAASAFAVRSGVLRPDDPAGDAGQFLVRQVELPYPALVPPPTGRVDTWTVELMRVDQQVYRFTLDGDPPNYFMAEIDPQGEAWEVVRREDGDRLIARPPGISWPLPSPQSEEDSGIIRIPCIPGRSRLVSSPVGRGDLRRPIPPNLPSAPERLRGLTEARLSTVQLLLAPFGEHTERELFVGRSIYLRGEVLPQEGQAPWTLEQIGPIELDMRLPWEVKVPEGTYHVVLDRARTRELLERIGIADMIDPEILEREVVRPDRISVRGGQTERVTIRVGISEDR